MPVPAGVAANTAVALPMSTILANAATINFPSFARPALKRGLHMNVCTNFISIRPAETPVIHAGEEAGLPFFNFMKMCAQEVLLLKGVDDKSPRYAPSSQG